MPTKPRTAKAAKPTTARPTKERPATAKPAMARPAVGGSTLHARIGALASQTPVATIEHGSLHAEDCLAWGTRWLLVLHDGSSRFDIATWAFVVVGADGVEVDRKTFEKASISKVFLSGDELVALHGEPPEMRVEVYRQTAAGKLELVTSRPGDESTAYLWKAHAYALAIDGRCLLTNDRETKSLLVYDVAPGFELTRLAAMRVSFGEKQQFVDTEGFGGVAVSGGRALLSGSGHGTGYQLVDLSDPRQPRATTTVRVNAPNLQETVHFLGNDRFLAYGWGGKALFLSYDPGKAKLKAQKSLPVGLRFERMHREDDELLLYNGNMKRDTGFGVKLGDPPESIGKIKLPLETNAITVAGGSIMFTGDERSLIFKRRS